MGARGSLKPAIVRGKPGGGSCWTSGWFVLATKPPAFAHSWTICQPQHHILHCMSLATNKGQVFQTGACRGKRCCAVARGCDAVSCGFGELWTVSEALPAGAGQSPRHRAPPRDTPPRASGSTANVDWAAQIHGRALPSLLSSVRACASFRNSGRTPTRCTHHDHT